MKTVKLCLSLAGVVLLIMTGCSNEKQVLRQRVAAQADTIAQINGKLQLKTDSLQNVTSQLNQTLVERDSVTKERETLAHNLRQLNSQVKQLKTNNQELEKSLDKSLALQDSIVTYCSNALGDSSRALGQLRTEISSAHLTISQRDSLLDEIRPWYTKWKHDATKRNFIKVLFGSGKAKPPNFPEPDMGSQ
jgi:chromosome segregation ATPase